MAIVLVDDHSGDGTRPIAQRIAVGATRPLEMVGAPPLPAGWSGKLWAVEQGVRLAGQRWPEARYLLLTDADIAHAPDNLARLVAKAERERLDLVSLMVRLRCASFWERLLVPAFVFFFQLLYPFAAVNEAGRRTAAAAGGCMLVRRRALREAGGIAAIRGALIDDVALARAIKRRPGGGRIWLGLGDSARSLRRYDRLGDDLGDGRAHRRHPAAPFAPAARGDRARHGACLRGPLLALLAWPMHGDAAAAALGGTAWLAMTAAYRPTVRRYAPGLGVA